jgi:hypothetical protein
MIKVVSLEDKETGIRLPQIVFDSRVDGYVGLAGFAWLNEKTIWQAIANTGIKLTDWIARKELQGKEPVMHIYMEVRDHALTADDAARMIHEQLKAVDTNYRDIESMLGLKPLRVTLLKEGAFASYIEAKQKAGVHLAQLKPKRVNASDATVQELLNYSAQVAQQ